jgi:hypothetical protein
MPFVNNIPSTNNPGNYKKGGKTECYVNDMKNNVFLILLNYSGETL